MGKRRYVTTALSPTESPESPESVFRTSFDFIRLLDDQQLKHDSRGNPSTCR